jgi:hypothetical protein
MQLFLPLDLKFNVLKLFLESILEDGLDLIETFLHLLKCFLFEEYPIVILFEMPGKVIEVLELLLLENIVHLSEDWRVFLLQNILINLKLLLTKHQALMLFVNLFHQSGYQLLELTM